MNTLLLRLCGPLQSWGVQSRFEIRETGREPSKSGVVGLLCAALGRPRTSIIEDLAGLRMGVRVDREGSLAREFQTIQAVSVDGQVKGTNISRRYYLSHADFLVGMESGDLGLLEQLQYALQHPRWMLYLGRRAFVPSEPIWLRDGLRPGQPLDQALLAYPWLASASNGQGVPDRLRMVLDDAQGEQVRPDQPISFAERRFAPRRVTTRFIPIADKSQGMNPEVS
jgi:CRISPR system Cascade subunit CasD